MTTLFLLKSNKVAIVWLLQLFCNWFIYLAASGNRLSKLQPSTWGSAQCLSWLCCGGPRTSPEKACPFSRCSEPWPSSLPKCSRISSRRWLYVIGPPEMFTKCSLSNRRETWRPVLYIVPPTWKTASKADYDQTHWELFSLLETDKHRNRVKWSFLCRQNMFATAAAVSFLIVSCESLKSVSLSQKTAWTLCSISLPWFHPTFPTETVATRSCAQVTRTAGEAVIGSRWKEHCEWKWSHSVLIINIYQTLTALCQPLDMPSVVESFSFKNME